MMVGSELEPFTGTEERFDVTAIVGLAGKLCGIVTVQCSSDCAGLIASGMLGAEINGQDRSALDAMGEICNMVAGNFKPKIPNLEDKCDLTVPTVIRGSHYRVRTVGNPQIFVSNQKFQGCPVRIRLVVHQYHG